MQRLQRIVLTPGEPAGIGPDIALRVAKSSWDADLIAIADPSLLSDRAKQLNLAIKIVECDNIESPQLHQPGTLKVYPISLMETVVPGKLNAANAQYVIRTLEKAAEFCQQQLCNALVTGPVHKGILNQVGIPFTGHTEFLAHLAQVPQTVMLFVVDQLKVALLTTHLPLKNVSENITRKRLQSVLTILHNELQHWFKLAKPRIAVCGLNPHAGEGGYLGREEIDTIAPALIELQKIFQDAISGPYPADTIFTPAQLNRFDAVLAMYHDQALPVIKHIGFDHAVNVTLGLPYIRTSVDHGTALDLAGSGKANASSLYAAIKLATKLIAR